MITKFFYPENLNSLKRPAAFFVIWAFLFCIAACAMPDISPSLRPLSLMERQPQKRVLYSRLARKIVPPTGEFIDTVLTDAAKNEPMSPKQRERIRQIIVYFWENLGWASMDDLANALGCSRPTFRKDFAKIDMKRLRAASREARLPVPLYFQYDSPKRRLLAIVAIVESLGWRSSVYEIASALGLKAAERGMVAVRDVFPAHQDEKNLMAFLADLNYNRSLNKELPLEIIVAKEKKEGEDRLIAAFQESNGRASSDELAARLGLAPVTVLANFRNLSGPRGSKLKILNAKLKAQGKFPIIGLVHGKGKAQQDEIIEAWEELHGVASQAQIAIRVISEPNSSVSRRARMMVNSMDWALINDIREQEGQFPLLLLNERSNGIAGTLEVDKDVLKEAMELHKEYYKYVGQNAFRNITLPLLYTVLIKNLKLAQLSDWKKKDGMAHLVQFILFITYKYAEEKGLMDISRPAAAGITRYDAMLDYFRYAVPRALNISRTELANVDLEALSPMLFVTKREVAGGKSAARPISPESEKNLRKFLSNLKKTTGQMLKESRQRQRIAERAAGSSILRARAAAERGILERQNIERLVEEINECQRELSDPDVYKRSAAAKRLGELPGFSVDPEGGAHLIQLAAGILGRKLFGDNIVVRIASAKAIGELAVFGPLGERFERGFLFQGLSQAYEHHDLQKEIIRILSTLKSPSPNMQHTAREQLAPIIWFSNDMEMQQLTIRALGNYGFAGEKGNGRFSDGIFRSLSETLTGINIPVTIITPGQPPAQTIDSASPRFSKMVQVEAIEQIIDMIKRTTAALRTKIQETGRLSPSSEQTYQSIQSAVPSAWQTFVTMLYPLLNRRYPHDVYVRLEAGMGIQELYRNTLLLLSDMQAVYPEYSFGSDIAQVKEIVSRNIAALVLGDPQYGDERIEKSSRVKRVLLEILAEFGTPQSVDSKKLIGLVFSEEPSLCRQAASTILEINDPEAVGMLRQIHIGLMHKNGSGEFVHMLGDVLGMRPSVEAQARSFNYAMSEI